LVQGGGVGTADKWIAEGPEREAVRLVQALMPNGMRSFRCFCGELLLFVRGERGGMSLEQKLQRKTPRSSRLSVYRKTSAWFLLIAEMVSIWDKVNVP
jgi:hypothetical protein